jgi:hypothetical protein
MFEPQMSDKPQLVVKVEFTPVERVFCARSTITLILLHLKGETKGESTATCDPL